MAIKPIHAITRSQLNKKGAAVRRTSIPVNFGEDDVQQMVADLRDTFRSSPIAVGLAAIQIGIDRRLFIANVTRDDDSQELIAINPVILEERGSKDKKFESCMSVPNWRSTVKRRDVVRIEFTDESGVSRQEEFRGFMARVILHEVDHLDGVLCHDRAEDGSDLQAFHFETPENYVLPPCWEPE